MREILFRGKTDDGWIYGNYIYAPGNNEVHNMCHSDTPYDWYGVYPGTIGQYIGVDAEDGTKIFEGDIIKLDCGLYGTHNVYVRDIRSIIFPINRDKIIEITIIGNVHDNPAMLDWFIGFDD